MAASFRLMIIEYIWPTPPAMGSADVARLPVVHG
jgi:hypothetical protein